MKRVIVITGAASGLGLAFARCAARRGDCIVMADVEEEEALARASAEIEGLGVPVLARGVDVRDADQVAELAHATRERFGAPHWVFNNAGVGGGGLIWESSPQDWQWILGVNVMGVVHGIRAFVPMMLERARAEPEYRGCVLNTAAMAGLLNAPLMGVYNASKHAVVSISETLQHDLALVTEQVRAAVLCPYFIPTGIAHSARNRPADACDPAPPTLSQRVAQMQSEKAVASGKLSAEELAARVFAELEAGAFYIYSHPQALRAVETRMQDILQARPPSDPFAERPEIAAWLRAQLRGSEQAQG